MKRTFLISSLILVIGVLAAAARSTTSRPAGEPLTQLIVPCEHTFSNGVHLAGQVMISPKLNRPEDGASVRVVAASLLSKAGQAALSHVTMMQLREAGKSEPLSMEGGPLDPNSVLDFQVPLAPVYWQINIKPVHGATWSDIKQKEQLEVDVSEK